MAAAEARAAFQRTVNRCFVQEDAKRAPRLACCQSSSSTSKQVDSGPANAAADGPDQPSIGFMPFSRASSYSNLLPDTKWWLQTQSSYGYQKIFTPEHVNALEAGNETSKSATEKSCTSSDIHRPEGGNTVCEIDGFSRSSLDTDHGVSALCTKRVNSILNEDIKTLDGTDSQECVGSTDMKAEFECLDKDSFNSKTVSKNQDEFYFDPDSPWIQEDKAEPWWWITDKDELAYWVAQKSLDHIENCDLPPPKKTCLNFTRYPYAQKQCYEHDINLVSTFESTHRNCGLDFCRFGKTQRDLGESIEQGNMLRGSLRSSSCTNPSNLTKTTLISEDNTSKAELMDALLHSQTRAREAEIAAKRAYAEKEHIVDLFFRQASQLFAYKQWFQLLQLESLQIKNNDQPMSTLFPLVLPWMSYKNMVSHKRWQRFSRQKRVKRDRHRSDISTYAVAFALGLSLVSAGLLLGWTVGWMLPSF
ncbi:uncharacterized protein LOC120084287 [Benincasa hispida]|uniref:uncharacterized protein LOC120084287 n=1 Tax=Benincasa hispida TaxID=102211 RepID=UPI001900B40B|nr:uncharacterized protein LOC120084287 [Benincasa hispida]XP_038896086.1 uncharacterized protein LOC120084287 [Benincasa hispida]XP_038896088.1 uncharacterized protein LOC120084287 [Benincasa hispida]